MIDTGSGAFVATGDIVGDTDDVFFDAVRKRIYVIGGEGLIDVFRRDVDRLQRLGRVSTRRGARTGLWVPSLNRLYLAVPQRGAESAEIRVFEAENQNR